MTEFELYLNVLFQFLAASLIVERMLEYLDKFFNLIGFGAGRSGAVLRIIRSVRSPREEQRRRIKKMLIMQSIGILTGITVCKLGNLGIFHQLGLGTQALTWWDVALSGILISGGSEPIHQMINFLNDHSDQLKVRRLELENEQPTVETIEKKSGFPHLGLEYHGGLDPKKPGHGLRKVNPKFIVIHHSSTDSRASFEDIVRLERKERRNEKGTYVLDPSYHCVITIDGQYHNYCRWDSVGWHVARGSRVSNANSLGLCFVGKFNLTEEEKLNQRIVNLRRPNEAQIETGAKVIALWRYLYDLGEVNIIAHSRVKRGHTDCPGNNFPFDRIVAKSTQILNQWKEDKVIRQELEQFKRLKYIYV